MVRAMSSWNVAAVSSARTSPSVIPRMWRSWRIASRRASAESSPSSGRSSTRGCVTGAGAMRSSRRAAGPLFPSGSFGALSGPRAGPRPPGCGGGGPRKPLGAPRSAEHRSRGFADDASRRLCRRRARAARASSRARRGAGRRGDRSSRRASDRHRRARGARPFRCSFDPRDRRGRGKRDRVAVARRRRRGPDAGAPREPSAVSVATAGALAAALAVTSALLAPIASFAVPRSGHPDARALADAGWRRPLWQWEGARAACALVSVLLALVFGLPAIGALSAGLIVPSVVIRLRADAATRRGRIATTRLLRGTEAVLRSGGALPEALRRAIEASDDQVARRPFAEALRAFDLGAPLDEALRSATSGTRDRRMRMAIETLAIGVTLRLPGDRAG